MAQRNRILIMAVVLFIAVAVVYGQSLNFDFLNWDDDVNVTQNQFYRPVASWSLKHFWVKPYFEFYLPVVYTVWGLEALTTQLGYDENSGSVVFDSRLFHGTNIVVHALNTVLVFSLILQIMALLEISGDLFWPAFAGALLFAVHPLQVEAVSWVTGLKDLLGGFFSLISLNLYILARQRSARWLLVGAWLAFLLAMLSKTGAVSVVLIMCFFEIMIFDQTLLQILKTLILWMAAGAPPVIMALSSRMRDDAFPTTLLERLVIAVDSLGFYLYKFLFPVNLVAAYERNPASVLHSGVYWGTGFLVLVTIVTMATRRGTRPAYFTAFAIFVAALYPYLGLIPFTGQNQSTVADRYAYIALVGPVLALAVWLARQSFRRQKTIAVTLTLIWATLSFFQCRTWKNTQTVFHHALDVNPDHGLAHFNLAADHQHRGEIDEAIREYRLALAHTHDDDAERSLRLLEEMKHQGQSVDFEHRKIVADLVDAGVMLAKSGRLAQAQKKFDAALALDPKNFGALVNTANVRAIQGDVDGALHSLEILAATDPTSADVFNNLGNTYLLHGDRSKAAESFKKAVALDPSNESARENLSRLVR